jgi:hypothetical protein
MLKFKFFVNKLIFVVYIGITINKLQNIEFKFKISPFFINLIYYFLKFQLFNIK